MGVTGLIRKLALTVGIMLLGLAAACGGDSGGDVVELVDHSPAAPPGMSHPLLRAITDRHHLEGRAKLGWTDVAFFAEHGVPAVNLGPGEPTLAHTAGECLERAPLESCFTILRDLLEHGA